MLRSYLLVAGLAACSLAVFASSGCGGTEVSGSGGGTDAGAAVHAAPPAAPPMKAPDGASSVTFAINKLYLGDTNRDGTANKVNGWKAYGYDLDGKISTASSTDVCKPRNNASPKNVYPDGNDGIDNSFGKNILGIILGIAADASTKVNEGITKGTFTIMLDMQKLGADSEYNPILTRLYGGANLMATPKFDGTDAWPVVPELLTDPKDITSAKVVFDKSYLTKNTWVSGSKGTINLNLSVQGFTLQLTIASALVSMDLDESHKTAKNGTIAGVLATDTLTTQLKAVAGAFDPSLCSGPTIDSIISQIQQASDIMADGSQDPTKTCDGISIGLGFDAALVKLGAIAPAAMGGGDPCSAPKDAGAD